MPTSTEIASKITAVVEQNRQRLLDDTVRIIQFRTVSGGNEQEEIEYRREIPNCFAWLGERARAMGFDFRVIQGVVGEISWKHRDPGAPVVGIAAHIDVVTAAKGDWTHPPFGGEIAEEQLWGRGTQDDKGPLIQCLYAMHAVKEAGIELPCTVNLIIGTQEETGDWSDMRIYLENAQAPDCAFTPDADFPIINGEKGMISVVFSVDWDQTPIHEETGMEFISLLGGERENIVPGSCELAIRFPAEHRTEVLKELVRTTTQFVVDNPGTNTTLQPSRDRQSGARIESVVSFIGKSAHASTPEKGRNAILDACLFIKDIETFPESVRKFAAFLYVAGAELNGANLGLDERHDFIGETTACLSLIDLRTTGGRGLFNIRPTMGLSCEQVLAKCGEAARAFERAAGLKMAVTQKGEAKNAIYLDPTKPRVAPFIEAMREAFEIVTGKKAELRAVGGTTYAKAIPNCCAFGPSLDEPDLIHQVDERTPVEAIIRNAKIYGITLGLLAIKGLQRPESESESEK